MANINSDNRDRMAKSRYMAFLFSLQFRRKISPALYMLSKKSLMILLYSLGAYLYFGEAYQTYILAVAVFWIGRSYIVSKMSFKAVNGVWNKNNSDGALPLFFYFYSKKEKYLKHNVEEK